jgi:hypothetical protein
LKFNSNINFKLKLEVKIPRNFAISHGILGHLNGSHFYAPYRLLELCV